MTLKIDIRYYDDAQEKAFTQWPLKERIDALVKNGLDVDELEFLTYSVFTEQRNKIGWRTYADMRTLLPPRAEMFRQYFDLSLGTVTSRFPASDSETSMTEKVGVATSLLAANRIFDLHEADWTKIPKGQIRTLDFFCASTGKEYVEIEAKGSIVADANMKNPSVSTHKNGILKKKAVQRERVGSAHPSLMMGTIAAVPENTDQRTVCWLIDPPGDGPEMDPKKFKLLTRLEYYLKELQPLSQASMLIALRNRIEAIFSVSDYERLDQLRLVGATGRPFRFRGPFFRNKTIIATSRGRAIGRVFHLADREFMFVGFDTEVYGLVARQRFREILAYKSGLASNESELYRAEAWLEQRDFGNEDPAAFGAEWIEQKKRFRLQLEGPVMFTQSGRVVGAFNPIGDRKVPFKPNLLGDGNGVRVARQVQMGGSVNSLNAPPVFMRS
ncbi:hypothetical protein [Corallococcus sp. CA053C]|uniref:hypothetical protein n=1 Tax=Corallococcus sp. CA053C TaxID=2316732 RepID=UPI0011C474B0|nr:hypothetical protein [Corallococcus sp. CA053C]